VHQSGLREVGLAGLLRLRLRVPARFALRASLVSYFGSDLKGLRLDDATLLMFFYGTLKRGGRNCIRYCDGALLVEEGTVSGDLYDLPSLGYPALVVPEESVYAFGTDKLASDAEAQRRLGLGHITSLEGPRVFGEVFVFDDPWLRLAAIDRLEGFDPAAVSTHYRRVLIPVETGDDSCLLAWAYAVEESSGVYLPGGRWPP
jgi:gamma-glutamylcyclotransferase (GGCT)/AIG2-like uncharacterized protein YtfP